MVPIPRQEHTLLSQRKGISERHRLTLPEEGKEGKADGGGTLYRQAPMVLHFPHNFLPEPDSPSGWTE